MVSKVFEAIIQVLRSISSLLSSDSQVRKQMSGKDIQMGVRLA